MFNTPSPLTPSDPDDVPEMSVALRKWKMEREQLVAQKSLAAKQSFIDDEAIKSGGEAGGVEDQDRYDSEDSFM
jgi:hypothetical protein